MLRDDNVIEKNEEKYVKKDIEERMKKKGVWEGKWREGENEYECRDRKFWYGDGDWDVDC